MPYSYIFSLVITSIAVLKDYLFKTRIYDYAIYFAVIMSWISTNISTLTFWCISTILVFLSFVLSKVLWDDKDEDESLFPYAEINNSVTDGSYMPFLKDYVGQVTSVLENGSYLGSIIKDNEINEIIVYSDDKLEKGDNFKILGIYTNKIKAIKI